MLIFVMPTTYPNEENPVANSFVKEQVAALSEKDCQIVVLNVRKQPSNRFFKKIDGGIHFINDGCSDVVYKKQKTFMESRLVFLHQWAFNRSMKKVYRAAVEKYGKPDLIYAHFYNAGYAAWEIVKKDEVPIVTLEHSGLLISEKMDLRVKHVLKKAVEKSDRYIVTTTGLQKYAKKHTGTKKELPIIPNMIDNSFVYAPAEPHEGFRFFSVARFEYDKRIDLLIEAFCDAFSAEDAVSLTIGGTGKEYERIAALIEEKQRNGQIKLLGRLSRDEVTAQMKECDCFALPSRHETFGLVWREALCVGRPVITTDHGGFSAADWKDSFGVMTPVDDKEKLIDAMKHVKNHYADYDLQQISLDNREMYAANKIAGKLLMLFSELTEREYHEK